MLVIITQLLPLYKITLLNLVLIGMISIHWPWHVQKILSLFLAVF